LLDFFRKLFSTDFMPHVYCLREPELVKLHFISDGIIALSYGLIPLALVLLIRRRYDLVFPWMFTLFGVFILGCGFTHVMSMVTLWHPIYRLDGLVKAITAAASFPTAVLLFRLLPRIQALPSPSQLRAEIEQRQNAETQLRRLNDELEQRVAERTAALEKANHRLAVGELRFRTLTEAVPTLLWTTDADGHCTYVSSRYEQYTGKPAEELIGDGWTRMLHPQDHARIARAWAAAVAKGEPYDVEYRLRHFDGAYRWFVARGIPICEANGNIHQWLGSSTDIHDLKQTEAALRRSNEELRQFAYAAAHDLQEPLRNVSNAVGWLRRRYRDRFDESADKWFNWSIEGAQRMHEMVKDLLSYSRAVDEMDRPQISVSTETAVKRALVNLAAAIDDSDASIEIGPLPQLRVFEAHLVQLFQNLIGNAIKYRQPNSRPAISISAERNGPDWQFSVKDNGIGFSREYADTIFGVFRRLHSRTEYPGNGIGLAICARIVAHYEGCIWADSQPGCGATFHFTFSADRLQA
jgi:PAS domain S-box-containing protein